MCWFLGQSEFHTFYELEQRTGLQSSRLEAQLLTTLDKILRLSSWMPSTTHNKRLRELLKDALRMLGGNEQYMDSLHDFMKRHIAFCAFMLDNAYAISTADIRKMADTPM